MCEINRRTLLKLSTGGLSILILPRRAFAAPADRRFFIQVLYETGVDNTLTFDARPLAFTKAGKVQNFTGKEPYKWRGSNGQETLAAEGTKALEHLRNDFSIINGVHMAGDAADGHTQNINYALAANPFGGTLFHERLGSAESAVRFAMFGTGFSINRAAFTNLEAGFVLDAASAGGLSQAVADAGGIRIDSPELKHLSARLLANSRLDTAGEFAMGSGKMYEGLKAAGPLADRLAKIQAPSEQGSEMVRSARVALEYLRLGITDTVVIIPNNTSYDAHSVQQCKQLAAQINGGFLSDVKEFIELLKNTDYMQGEKFIRRTTFMVSSEFTRTFRQAAAKSIDETGTDHNPFNNTVIVGGYGIRGGQVFGASDLDQIDQSGAFTNLTPVHANKQNGLNPDLLKAWGKPFDFENCIPTQAMPQNYQQPDYITYHSITNTVLDIVDRARTLERIKVGRNGPEAKPIKKLIG